LAIGYSLLFESYSPLAIRFRAEKLPLDEGQDFLGRLDRLGLGRINPKVRRQ
jgi:hypothetical protein